MFSRLSVDLLRILLSLALLLTAVLQFGILPWLSGVLAAELPAEAFMRWPILLLAIAGLACVEVALVCTVRLLGMTRRGEVFTPRSLRWVDGIIGAFLAASAVCMGTLIYQSFTVGGPPAWTLLLLLGVISGIGMGLLMGVMRSLLVQATTLREEMDLLEERPACEDGGWPAAPRSMRSTRAVRPDRFPGEGARRDRAAPC